MTKLVIIHASVIRLAHVLTNFAICYTAYEQICEHGVHRNTYKWKRREIHWIKEKHYTKEQTALWQNQGLQILSGHNYIYVL